MLNLIYDKTERMLIPGGGRGVVEDTCVQPRLVQKAEQGIISLQVELGR